MQTVICSHGFGVKADARGMFTEIEQSFPKVRFVMFDYNNFDNEGNTTVPALSNQAETLQQVIDDNPKGSILLCHSQGSLVAGMVDLSSISKVMLLAPPVNMSMERIIHKMARKPGGVIDLQGISKLPRSDGTVTHLPKDYLESLKNINPISMYAKIAATKPTIVVRSLNDEVLGLTNVNEIAYATVIDIEADHNFTGSSRKKLVGLLSSIISS